MDKILSMRSMESTYRPGLFAIGWAGNRWTYHIPEFLLDSVWCWVHEFSESAISEYLPRHLQGQKIKISLLGSVSGARVDHIMVSLHLRSLTKVGNEYVIVQPEAFGRDLPWRRRHD